jgi:hypothetical protein
LSASVTRRLPGFRFEVQTPPLAETLPRMDVAVFVGFAASGPLHTPVVISDVAQFTAVFGDDAPLCWDASRGETVVAHLASAVRAFFGNGGRRCWVVRVARLVPAESGDLNRARSNYFPVPGLALAEFGDDGEVLRLSPAFARARSEGSWSDSLLVSSALLSRPLQVLGPVQTTGPTGNKLSVRLAVGTSKDVSVGDLLRLTYDEGDLLFLIVESVETPYAFSPPLDASPPEGQAIVEVTAAKFVRFRQTAPAGSPPDPAQINAYLFTSEREAAEGSPPPPDNDRLSIPDFTSQPIAVLNDAADWPIDDDGLLNIKLDLAFADAPAPGSLVRIDVGEEQLWLTVQEQGVRQGEGSPPGEAVEVIAKGLWWSAANGPTTLPGSTPSGERLNFELWCRQGEDYLLSLSDLGFESAHPRYWASLPTDAERYSETDFNKGRTELAFDKEPVRLWQTGGEALFPLAGSAAVNTCCLPLAVPILPEQYLGPVKLPGTVRERDGLALFDASLFIDPALAETFTEDFMVQADFIRFLGPSPRELIGIHAALGVEEATILSVPDAVHLGWFKTSIEEASPPDESLPLPRPEWWHFLGCKPSAQTAPPCLERPWTSSPDETGVAAPELTSSEVGGQEGTFMLSWASSSPPQNARYILEESLNPDLSDAASIYYGTDDQLAVYGRGTGDYYYRVRAQVGEESSDWSNIVSLRAKFPLVHEPVWGNFMDCSIRVIEPPLLRASETVTQTGTFTLTWEMELQPTLFILEEATSPDFGGAVTIYRGPLTRLQIYGHAEGDYFYRVRAELEDQKSDWSAGVAVRVTQAVGWRLNAVELFNTDTLLAVQRAMLRMCAGRGDLFAVLALPEHYREDQAIEYVRTLKATDGPAVTFDAPGVDAFNPSETSLLSFPLGQREQRDFSYSAIYHPWLIEGELIQERVFRRNPPDGTVCGIYARRALERGAWIAPANELMRGVISLTPAIPRARRLDLQQSQINLIRQEPRGFVTLSADTLSDDEDLRPVGVRRLLILLRRLALRLGATYVFEPHSDSFRRLVRRGFEALLDQMFERGAFAGKTPETSYRVVTDSALNTPQSVEQGRFIVELKVAPSLPLTFLTVRLVQTNNRGFVSEGR